MYLWRIEGLKSQLAAGQLGERQTFSYVVAYLVLWVLCSEMSALFPAENRDAWSILFSAVVILGITIGTFVAFQANGGDQGRNFTGRFFALAWVLTIRFFGFGIPAILVFYIWVGAQGASVTDARWLDTSILLAFLGLYYWRLAAHIRSVAMRDMRLGTVPAGLTRA